MFRQIVMGLVVISGAHFVFADSATHCGRVKSATATADRYTKNQIVVAVSTGDEYGNSSMEDKTFNIGSDQDDLFNAAMVAIGRPNFKVCVTTSSGFYDGETVSS